MSESVVVSSECLQAYCQELFTCLGLSKAHAQLSAENMVLTNLWGIDSHGVLRLPIYVERLLNGAINTNPSIQASGQQSAFEVLDGDGGMGYVVGHFAVDRAIELAKSSGMGAIAVRNSNHFGAAALYVKKATDNGMIALSMTNVGPNLVVPGGSKPITGNNPLAFGAPTRRGFPLLLDISMSAVAGGKLLLAKETGDAIPEGWATDKEGRPTTDPVAGFDGFLLPLGGHKGFGLSLMIDILCGVMTGGRFQFGINSMYAKPEARSETGHMMIVINPALTMEQDAFLDRMDAFCDTVKSSPMWDEKQSMYIPGEIEHLSRLDRLVNGIPLPAGLYEELQSIALKNSTMALVPMN